ncbi:MAG: uracil-DNA glycosylase [Clostridia bacterium]|nr:uracil-DNA glycosylase [Clostridia bacterium]MBO7549240.1 uracil-DNA glycosylase [Clostridia bacterium]MBP5238417.1 uracil-DNA glycosylase [Clostridia bacterium]MBP5656925.1 uracil-DNA glycosylase [Clostridia bacterium]MBP5755318.1 uracil-DNA glycosylase [Clostridia bacterium]
MVNIGNSWDEILKDKFSSPEYLALREFLKDEYRRYTVYPGMYDIFNAFKYTPYEEVKAVILGQDPYHGEGQAHGLAFSVREGVEIPPSLRNIFKELHDETGAPIPESGCLDRWAKQGVLLLNSVLTVRAGMAGSHRSKGWEQITDAAIAALNAREKPMVFLLWGAFAKEKLPLITNRRHLVLQAPHPSPLSAFYGFFGCGHFAKCNEFLSQNGIAPIEW